MRDMTWNVYVENFNQKRIEKYDIFKHAKLMEDIRKNYKKNKNDFDTFAQILKRDIMYYFWSKCEWEIVLTSWPEYPNFNEEKIDVYDQIMLNWDVFVKYVWEMCHARKLKTKKEK